MKMGEKAISEIVGAIVLLAMAIVVFSLIYINVLADEGPNEKIYTTVSCHLLETESTEAYEGYLLFENEKGESLSPEDIVNVIIGGETVEDPPKTIGYFTENSLLNVGDNFLYPIPEYGKVYANIVDTETNSMVFYGTLRDGYSYTSGSIHFPFNFLPGSINVNNRTGYTAVVTPPEGFSGYDIDKSSVYICNINDNDVCISPEEDPDMFENKMMVKFENDLVDPYLFVGKDNLIGITGKLLDGETFFEYYKLVKVVQD